MESLNIPTDLLRTLIAVIDLRSFTRAAHSLGVTQPAVSAQIKRLQLMLGVELFDKSAPGVTLSAKGETFVNYARRMLALNDQMLDATVRGGGASRLRVGLATDYFEEAIHCVLARFRARHPDIRFQIYAEHSASLLRDLRRGDYDLVVAASDDEEPELVHRSWQEPTAWAALSAEIVHRDGPLPLLVAGESSLSRRLGVAALEQAGISYEVVYVGRSFNGMVSAAKAGLGVACWARRLLVDSGLVVIDDACKLPRVPAVCGGVYVRESAEFAEIDELADAIAASVRGETGIAGRFERGLALC